MQSLPPSLPPVSLSARTQSGPRLHSVSLLVRPFLDSSDRTNLCYLSRYWPHWELCGDSPLACPRLPMKRRLQGFGKLNPKLSVTHSLPSPYWLVHMAWDYLDPLDCHMIVTVSPPLEAYARLRRSTVTVSIASLRDPRPPPDTFVGLQKDWACTWR